MNVLINTNYSAACTDMLFELGEKFQRAGHNVVRNDWNHYEKYDLIFFVAKDPDIQTAKKKNPEALVGLMCPWINGDARAADFLILDSIEMRETFLSYNKNYHIFYFFPEIKYISKTHTEKEKIVIGYHGNKIHLNCAQDMSRALDRLSETYPIEFKAIYNIKDNGKWTKHAPKKCPVRHIQWSAETFYEELKESDIGAVPAKIPVNKTIGNITTRFLSSFPINWPRYYGSDYLLRFKHATNPMRAYSFSQLDVPVVAEFLPSYCQMIRDSHSGFLVYSEEGWYHALKKLILDAKLRTTMSKNLKTYLDDNFSPEKNFEKLLSYINSRINSIHA